MRCFFCEKLDDEFAVLSKQEEYHLFKVLRTEPGKEVLLINGKGIIAECIVDENRIIKILKRKEFKVPKKRIHLFTALPRKHRMDNMLAQCTETGMWALHPIITERSIVVPKKENMVNKWKEKVIEACKQAQNPFVPEIYNPLKLKEALALIKKNKICSYYGATDNDELTEAENKRDSDIAWFVGPEGGFTDIEEQILRENGVNSLSLGSWIMRVETAALAGVLLLQR